MFVLFSISVRFYSSIYFIRFSMIILCRTFRLVGSSGLEPPTSRLSGVRSNHLSYEPIKLFSMYLVSLAFVCFALIHSPLSSPSCDVSDFSELPRVRPRRLAAGGDDGIRTHDPLLAGQVLSQLSYTPILFWGFILSSLSVTQN